MEQAKIRGRRRHGVQLKEQVLAKCAEPGASVAAVALAHGLNTNLVHKWRREANGRARDADAPPAQTFIPIAVTPSAPPLRSERLQPQRREPRHPARSVAIVPSSRRVPRTLTEEGRRSASLPGGAGTAERQRPDPRGHRRTADDSDLARPPSGTEPEDAPGIKLQPPAIHRVRGSRRRAAATSKMRIRR
jgi:transposase